MTKRIQAEKPPPTEHCCRCGRPKAGHYYVALHKAPECYVAVCPTALFELDTLQQAMEDER